MCNFTSILFVSTTTAIVKWLDIKNIPFLYESNKQIIGFELFTHIANRVFRIFSCIIFSEKSSPSLKLDIQLSSSNLCPLSYKYRSTYVDWYLYGRETTRDL